MTSDEVPPKIVSAVLAGKSKQQSPKGENSDNSRSKLSEEEEAVATKYRKMIKVKIPPEAVRQRMTMKGVDAKIIDAVFAADAADPTLQDLKDSRSKLSEEEEAVATRFYKMIKMMIPPEACVTRWQWRVWMPRLLMQCLLLIRLLQRCRSPKTNTASYRKRRRQ